MQKISIIIATLNCSRFLDACLESIVSQTYKNKEIINVKFNDREGHYLLLTKRRCKLLKTGLEKVKKIKVGYLQNSSNAK